MQVLRILTAAASALLLQPSASAAPGATPSSSPSSKIAVELDTNWIAYRTGNRGTILFPVRVNGHNLVALLDTAAPATVLDTTLVSRLRLHETGSGKGDGRDFSRSAEGLWFETGGRTVGPFRLAISDLAPFSAAARDQIDIIFGTDMILGALEIDPARQRLRLRHSGAEWPDATSLMLSRTTNGHYHLARFRINKGAPFTAILDTGFAGGVSLNAAAAPDVFPKAAAETTVAVQTWTGVQVSRMMFAPSLSLSGRTVHAVELVTEPANAERRHLQPADGIIGMQVLGQYHMLADLRRGRLFLRPSGVNPAPGRRSTVGLQGLLREGAYEVVHVMANSPAEEGGWRNGDKICALDGVPASQLEDHPATRDWRFATAARVLSFRMCDGSTRRLVSAEFY